MSANKRAFHALARLPTSPCHKASITGCLSNRFLTLGGGKNLFFICRINKIIRNKKNGGIFHESHGDCPESHGDFPESNGDFWTFNVFIAPRYEIPPGRPEMLPWSIFFSSKMGAVPMLTTRIFQDVPKENKKSKKNPKLHSESLPQVTQLLS